MELEFRLDDALAPSRSQVHLSEPSANFLQLRGRRRQGRRRTFPGFGFQCGARAFASQGLVSGSRVSNSRSVGAGSWAPTEGGKRGVRTVGRDGERGRRGDLSTGAGGGCTSRMCEAACPAQHWILLWSAAGGRERKSQSTCFGWMLLGEGGRRRH